MNTSLWGKTACLTLVLGSTATAVAQPTAGGVERQKVAVMAVQREAGVSEELARSLDELILDRLHAYDKLEVIGYSDIAAMLENEATRQQLDTCADDVCLAEIAGALGAALLVRITVGKVGERFVLSAKMLDAERAVVMGRASETVGEDAAALTDVAPVVLRTMLHDAASSDAPRAEVLAASIAWQPRSALRQVAPWLALGVSGASLVGATVLGWMARSDAATAQDAYAGTQTWQSADDSAHRKAQVADALFGVAAVSAVGSAMLAWWNRDGADEPDAVETSVSVTPRGDGVSLALRGVW